MALPWENPSSHRRSESSSSSAAAAPRATAAAADAAAAEPSAALTKLHSHSLFAWLFAFNEAGSDVDRSRASGRGCVACILHERARLELRQRLERVPSVRRCCSFDVVVVVVVALLLFLALLLLLLRCERRRHHRRVAFQNINRCACREMRIVFIEDLSGGTFSSLILTRCWWYRDSKHEIPQFVGQCTVQCAVCESCECIQMDNEY